MVGELFKENREKQGLDLKDVAVTLRIRYEYLKALEENLFEKLPADVYTKGYIREYARFLGLDPEQLINDYIERINPPRRQTGHDSLNEKGVPETPPAKNSFFIYAPILLIVSVIFLFFANLYVQYQRALIIENQGKYVSEPSVMADAQKGVPPEQNAASVYKLELTATEKTWLRIESGDAEPDEVLMEPGDSIEWESKEGFNLKLGNAGGVRAALNGKDIGILGERGKVIKIRLPREEPLPLPTKK